MVKSVPQLVDDYRKQYAQPSTLDLQAGADREDPVFPNPSGEKTVDMEASGGVLSFAGAGRTMNVKATEHFLVLGNTVTAGTILQDCPEPDAKYLINVGKAVEATPEEVTAAQKASKK